MRTFHILIIATFVVFGAGCFLNFETVEGLPEFEPAKALSDKIVSQVIAEKNDEIYSEMDDVFRSTYSSDIIPTTFEKVFGHFGKPLEAEYRTEEQITWQYPDGSKKLARKFWYKVKTYHRRKREVFPSSFRR